jgi:hypothetical protein
MKVEVNLKAKTLKIEDRKFNISCVVRNELNGWRSPSQVIRSIPENKPVYPRQFPRGSWHIYAVEHTDNIEYSPIKIKTNAFQMLPVWALSIEGHYMTKTGEYTRDEAYWMHYATKSTTTLGCIRLNSVSDAFLIGRMLEDELKTVDYVPLEVI